MTRKVDRLSCVRFGSARYSVPCRLIGHQVTITTTATTITIVEPVTGEVLAEHRLEWVRAAENVCLIGPSGTE